MARGPEPATHQRPQRDHQSGAKDRGRPFSWWPSGSNTTRRRHRRLLQATPSRQVTAPSFRRGRSKFPPGCQPPCSHRRRLGREPGHEVAQCGDVRHGPLHKREVAGSLDDDHLAVGGIRAIALDHGRRRNQVRLSQQNATRSVSPNREGAKASLTRQAGPPAAGTFLPAAADATSPVGVAPRSRRALHPGRPNARCWRCRRRTGQGSAHRAAASLMLRSASVSRPGEPPPGSPSSRSWNGNRPTSSTPADAVTCSPDPTDGSGANHDDRAGRAAE